MLTVIRREGVLELRSRMPAGQRALFVVFALIPLLAPYELLLRPEWRSYLHPFFLLAAAISVGALGVSGLLVWAALAGVNSRLTFDQARGTVTYATGAPVVAWRSHTRPLASVARISVEQHDWSDGAPSYSLVLHLADGSHWKAGSSWSREEVEALGQRLAGFPGIHMPTGPS